MKDKASSSKPSSGNALWYLFWRSGVHAFQKRERKDFLLLVLFGLFINLPILLGQGAAGPAFLTPEDTVGGLDAWTNPFFRANFVDGIFWLTYLLNFVMLGLGGLRGKLKLFQGADVVYLFCSPLRPTSVWLFAILRQQRGRFWSLLMSLYSLPVLSKVLLSLPRAIFTFVMGAILGSFTIVLATYLFEHFSESPQILHCLQATWVALALAPTLVFAYFLASLENFSFALHMTLTGPWVLALPVIGPCLYLQKHAFVTPWNIWLSLAVGLGLLSLVLVYLAIRLWPPDFIPEVSESLDHGLGDESLGRSAQTAMNADWLASYLNKKVRIKGETLGPGEGLAALKARRHLDYRRLGKHPYFSWTLFVIFSFPLVGLVLLRLFQRAWSWPAPLGLDDQVFLFFASLCLDFYLSISRMQDFRSELIYPYLWLMPGSTKAKVWTFMKENYIKSLTLVLPWTVLGLALRLASVPQLLTASLLFLALHWIQMPHNVLLMGRFDLGQGDFFQLIMALLIRLLFCLPFAFLFLGFYLSLSAVGEGELAFLFAGTWVGVLSFLYSLLCLPLGCQVLEKGMQQ